MGKKHLKTILCSTTVFSLILFAAQLQYTEATPVSYWKFEQNLNDSGTYGNTLHLMSPVFACSVEQVTACWPDSWLALTQINYINTPHTNKGHSFNGFTYFTAGANTESQYDFLDPYHTWTIEFWAAATPHCPNNCTHQYLASKARSTPDGYVHGWAVGINGNGQIYAYQRSNTAILMGVSNDQIFDGTPKKYTVVYHGTGTWNDYEFFVNGEPVQKRPFEQGGSVMSFSGSAQNDEAFVIGNYWYRTGQTFRTGWLDNMAIFDYARTPTQIQTSYMQDIGQIPTIEHGKVYMKNGALWWNGTQTQCKLTLINNEIRCTP
jgi:hypothetical protein